MKIGSRGEYTIYVTKSDGSIKQKLHFPNLITNIGLEQMANNNDWLLYCRVGSGSSAPEYTDTQLVNQIASFGPHSAVSDFTQTTPPYRTHSFKRYTFPVGTVTGNISEIGVGWGATGNTLFSRALILDSLGNPTSITVLSDESLVVEYRHYYYLPDSDWTGEVTLTGNIGGVYDIIGRAANALDDRNNSARYAQTNTGSVGIGGTTAGVSINDIAAVTSSPGNLTGSGVGRSAVVIGPTTVRHTMVVPPTVGNSGIRSVLIQMGNSAFQYQFDPPIPKTSDDTVTLNFDLSWGRYAE